MSVVATIAEADPRILAVAGGVSTALFVHKFPLRGDVALILGCALTLTLFLTNLLLDGASALKALVYATILLACHCGSLVLVTVAWRLSPFHPLAKFPGPLLNRMTSLTLVHMVFSGKRYLVIKDLHRKYGKFVRTGPNTLSINSPKAVPALYSSSNAFSKSNAYIPGRLHPDGLFFIMDRDVHNVRRKVWAPGFTPSALTSYKPLIERRIQQMLDTVVKRRNGPHGTVNWTELVQHWSYDVMGELSYGSANKIELMEEGDPHGYVMSGHNATIAFESLGEAPALFDIFYYLPVTKAVNALEKLGERLIIARQDSPAGSSNDLASHLLGEHDPTQPKLSGADLRVDSLFAIQAGSDTTSGVLTFMFYHLIKNREAYDRLLAELDESFPDPDAPLNMQTLTSLPYLNAVVEESLRLGTPFGGLPRVVPKGGSMLDDVFVPEDTIVAIPPWTSQTDPANVWPEPDAYKPERWLPGGLGPGSKIVKSAMLSFSYGPFGCLGKTLAIQELRLVAAKVFLTYDLKFSPEFDNEKFVKGIDNMRATVFRYPLLVTAQKRF